MSGVRLVLPMAGRGSRFERQGIRTPKPLVDLAGRPFFWWAVESVRRAVPVEDMVFVILREHAAAWSLDRCIQGFYPEARIVQIAEVTSGSAETAAIGAEHLADDGPLLVQDCDHAFVAPGLKASVAALRQGTDGMLLTFASQSPNYAYLSLAADGTVEGTVEKQAVSPYAIAGCYGFSSAQLLLDQQSRYRESCPYPELFVSGLYNQMLAQGLAVGHTVLQRHFAFGTPEELASVAPSLAASLASWKDA